MSCNIALFNIPSEGSVQLQMDGIMQLLLMAEPFTNEH